MVQVCRITLRMILATGAAIPIFCVSRPLTLIHRQATALLILLTTTRIPITTRLIPLTAILILATARLILMTDMINICHGNHHSGDGSTSASHGNAHS